jgi:hypothetical protein
MLWIAAMATRRTPPDGPPPADRRKWRGERAVTAAPENDDPYAELEAEAAELLDALPDDPEASAKGLIDKLRKQLAGRAKQEQAAYDRGRAEALAEVKTQAERAKVLAKHGLPPSLQKLVDDVDVADEEALTARLEALRADGITWGQQSASATTRPQPGQATTPGAPAPAQQQLDPGQIVSAFQQTAAGGIPADHGGGLLRRVARDGLGAIQGDQDASDFEQQLNAAVRAAGQQARAGIQG